MLVLGGVPRKILDDIDSAVSFSPDGALVASPAWDAERRRESIALLEVAKPMSLRILPIPGGQPKQLTHFESDFIFAFAWSHDGK